MVRTNPRTIAAIGRACTARYVEASAAKIDEINRVLLRHVSGECSLSEAVTDVQLILGDSDPRRAKSICYTEVGRAYSVANYERLLEQLRFLPGMKKSWKHSQENGGCAGHLEVSKQAPIPVEEPFRIANPETGEIEELRFPRDPQASLANTVDCACMLIAVVPEDEEYQPLRPEDLVPPDTAITNGELVKNGVPTGFFVTAPELSNPPSITSQFEGAARRLLRLFNPPSKSKF